MQHESKLQVLENRDRGGEAVAEAYARVADGFRHALEVTGLPPIEEESLRRSLRAALQLAQQPVLALQR